MNLPTFAKNRGQSLVKTNMGEGEDGIRGNPEVKAQREVGFVGRLIFFRRFYLSI